MSHPVFSLRPNPENPEHRRTWEILQSIPEGQKNRFLVREILQEDFVLHLEGMVQKVVWEELEGVRLEKKSAFTEPEIPGQMLDFLSQIG